MSRRLGATAASLALVGLVAFGVVRSRASDHGDGASIASDPTTDIADVYAFMRPVANADGGAYERSDHLVMIMTVHPNAPVDARFDAQGDYLLNVFGTQPAPIGPDAAAPDFVNLSMSCHFQLASDAGTQPFICSINGFFVAGDTESTAGLPTDPVRVFAGRRADPAFGSVKAAVASIDAGAFLDGGRANDFANQNVLAIVAEIDVDRVLFGDAGRWPLVVSGATGRLSQ